MHGDDGKFVVGRFLSVSRDIYPMWSGSACGVLLVMQSFTGGPRLYTSLVHWLANSIDMESPCSACSCSQFPCSHVPPFRPYYYVLRSAHLRGAVAVTMGKG